MKEAFQCPDCGRIYTKPELDSHMECPVPSCEKPLVRVLVFTESELEGLTARAMFNTEYPDEKLERQSKQTKIIWRALAKRFLISQGEISQGKSPQWKKKRER